MLESAKVILGFGGLGVLLAMLVGIYLLIKLFMPQLISMGVNLATSLAKFSEKIESFGDKIESFGGRIESFGVKVDNASAKASEAAADARATRTGSMPAVSATVATGAAPPPSPPRP